MPELYDAVVACSAPPHIMPEWIGAPYAARNVTYGAPELLAVNPAGAVPTLRGDDGWLLTQGGRDPWLSGPQAPRGRSDGRRQPARQDPSAARVGLPGRGSGGAARA